MDETNYVRLQNGQMEAQPLPELESICPSCGSTDELERSAYYGPCANVWHEARRSMFIAALKYNQDRCAEFEVQVNALITVRDRQKVEIAELRKEIERLEGALEE